MYGLRGLPFVTATGLKRRLLCWTEMIACGWAHRVVAVSRAIRQTIIETGLCPADKIVVLANGSSNGVDSQVRFNPGLLPPHCRETLRQQYNIPLDSLVVGFVGRIVRDKGIIELEASWRELRRRFPELLLLLVGDLETQDPIPAEVWQRLQADPKVIITGWVNDLAPFYAAMDIMVLPTYREGFPNTPLEAAAMRIPVVTTSVDGCPEATLSEITGIIVPPRNSPALTMAIERLILNPDLGKRMGEAGREWVVQQFRPVLVWQALYEQYLELLQASSPESAPYQ